MKNFFAAVVLILSFISQVSISQNTVSIRLGPSTGQDCMLFSNFANTPLPNHPDCLAESWTVGGNIITGRALFKFNLHEIPSDANIINAKLSLYGNLNSTNPPHSGENRSYIRRVMESWNDATATWNTQPGYSTVNQASLQESISPYEDYIGINVTELVRAMVADSMTNFGFILMIQIEAPYACMNFSSGDAANFDRRPKLEITYTPTIGITPISLSVPKESNLFQNYPNPFNPTTNIKFDVPKTTFTSLKIYNELGNEVSTLVNENLNPGSYEVKWNGNDFSSGAYFIRFESNNNLITKRMMLIK